MTIAQYDAKFLKSMKIKPEPISAAQDRSAAIARALILLAEAEQYCEAPELTPAAEIERLRERFRKETEERG